MGLSQPVACVHQSSVSLTAAPLGIVPIAIFFFLDFIVGETVERQ